MISTKSIFTEIRNNAESFRMFLSIASKGELQGGWENERISALAPNAELAAKIARHGADETKHGLMFSKLLQKAGHETVDVPESADYCLILERKGIGLSHARLLRDEPLSEGEILEYLVHSKITEERALDEVNRMLKVFKDDALLGPSLKVIADDEINHLSYAHEELLRLRDAGHQLMIHQMLKRYARAEALVYRDVGFEFIHAMASLLGWGIMKVALLRFGVLATYWVDRSWGARRIVGLRKPVRPNAMGTNRAPIPANG